MKRLKVGGWGTVMTVGFIGVGTIATAMVRGLRQRWPELEVHLSPRSEAASLALVAGDDRMVRHESNASVVAASEIVFLTMLPPYLDEALGGVRFREEQMVVSCVGGTSLADVERMVAPAFACRAIPLPAIARGEGPIVLYKASAEVRGLLQGLGDVIEVPEESAFQAYVGCSAFMSTYFRLQEAMIEEMVRGGAEREGAMRFAQSMLRSLAETSVRTDTAEFGELVERHATPGGLNERVRKYLEGRGWFDEVRGAIEAIATLRRGELMRIPSEPEV